MTTITSDGFFNYEPAYDYFDSIANAIVTITLTTGLAAVIGAIAGHFFSTAAAGALFLAPMVLQGTVAHFTASAIKEILAIPTLAHTIAKIARIITNGVDRLISFLFRIRTCKDLASDEIPEYQWSGFERVRYILLEQLNDKTTYYPFIDLATLVSVVGVSFLIGMPTLVNTNILGVGAYGLILLGGLAKGVEEFGKCLQSKSKAIRAKIESQRSQLIETQSS